MGRSKRDAHASAPPSGEQPHASSLSRTQADDVLRYWLAAVRLEETLKVRPRARRVKHESAVPRLDLPASGQEYFKLALDDALAGLLADKQTLERAFDGELAAFFEGWLLSQYRRGQEEHELSHLLCFPIVHSARGELAGLLRAGVRLRFGSPEGPAFRTPSRGERQRGAYPAPPSEVRIVSAQRSEGTWPFFIDTRLLSYPLGVSSEEIDALFDALRAEESVSERKMLTLVAETLERAVAAAPDGLLRAAPLDQTDSHVSALLERLRRAMQSLLARGHTRAEVYPVALVIDGTQAKTTWHLQRELTSLLEAQGEEAWPR
ncbi:MAG: hypothetical protein JWN48_3653, partial [Myxococcaceae bacterium]|nr:hypothetical protein [Myxococcaceae bacterium]